MKLISYIFIGLAFSFFLLVSCDSVPQSEVLYKQMMEAHHKDMMVWGEIPELKIAIKSELATVGADSVSSKIMEDEGRVEKLEKELKSLESADDLMKDWMAQFKAPKGKPEEEAMSYLNDQNEKMIEMGKKVAAAVEHAKDLINSK